MVERSHLRYVAHLGLYAVLSLGWVACQSTSGHKASSDSFYERQQRWGDVVDQAISMGKDGIPFLEKVLIGDEYKEVEDDFSDIDGPGSEAVLFSLKRRAAIEAARYYDFEDLLTRFYYGDLKAACALSADQQIEKAVRVLVRIGPRTERTLPIGARFELLSKTITNGTAQVTCSMIPEGRYKVSLRKRGCAGAEVWIPVEIEVLGVY